MSAEVVDSNPYSRLMALNRMGIVDNYEDIRSFTVAIVVRMCMLRVQMKACITYDVAMRSLTNCRVLEEWGAWPQKC